MTDNEIIKALECCRDCNCKECPACRIIDGGTHCTEIDEEEILDLINRQKAEIERLQALADAELDTIHKLGDDYERALEEEQEIKAEAIKEFAERLKGEICNIFGFVIGSTRDIDIDKLVKEMVGDAE